MGPCIVSIFQYISNKMQRYTVYLYLETALPVSGGTYTHHKEQFPDINKLCNVVSCWIYDYIGIRLGAHTILHISRIRVNIHPVYSAQACITKGAVCLFMQLRIAALRLIVRSWLDLSTSATRRLHASPRESAQQQKVEMRARNVW
jgi:hypothetical protein